MVKRLYFVFSIGIQEIECKVDSVMFLHKTVILSLTNPTAGVKNRC